MFTKIEVPLEALHPVIVIFSEEGASMDGAEEVGFEPTKACTLHDFQSCSLGHYETPPGGGESGIRTHEGLHPTAFRERHFRPLRHLSAESIAYLMRCDKR